MSEDIKLTAQARDRVGKGAARELRRTESWMGDNALVGAHLE